MRQAVVCTDLTKAFGASTVIDGIDLEVPAGTVCGLLGPNGAGKTTLVRMLSTLLAPDAGTAHVMGHDVVAAGAEVRRRIAVTGQQATLDQDLTGRENLLIIARLLGFARRQAPERAAALLEAFELVEAADRPVKSYSGGMRRRLDLAASIVKRPEVFFLDEPTTGLDPRSRQELWAAIRVLRAQGTTILLTTQYLEEADALADRLVVLDAGRVVAQGTPRDLKDAVGARTLRVRVDGDRQREALMAIADATGRTPTWEPGSGTIALTDVDEARTVDALASLAHRDIPWTGLSVAEPSLDEVFLALTGSEPRRENVQEVQA